MTTRFLEQAVFFKDAPKNVIDFPWVLKILILKISNVHADTEHWCNLTTNTKHQATVNCKLKNLPC